MMIKQAVVSREMEAGLTLMTIRMEMKMPRRIKMARPPRLMKLKTKKQQDRMDTEIDSQERTRNSRSTQLTTSYL